MLSDIDRWTERGDAVALATVIQTWGSAPREVGAKMAMTADGEIAGSVSGGCVEGAVFETGADVLKTARPTLLHFGVADDTAWSVGLACGGTIEVFVEPLAREWFQALRECLTAERPAATVTVVRGPEQRLGRKMLVTDDGPVRGTIGEGADELALAAARKALAAGQSERVALAVAEPTEVFVEVYLPSPALVIVGGVHIAIALASLAKTLGYRTIVVDPRKAFGAETRFPHVDRLIQSWPDEALTEIGLSRSTAVAMLTHDPKLDDPGLKVALPSPAFYVGALGSRKTQDKRRKRLLAEGLTEAQLDRLRGPIGLDIGARTPEEIALGVMAEIVAARNGQLT
ncbi:MAG: XdhC family protein [Chloroflexi bacterium]|nr:XdhC family protein [Chloroflexota bacterium]